MTLAFGGSRRAHGGATWGGGTWGRNRWGREGSVWGMARSGPCEIVFTRPSPRFKVRDFEGADGYEFSAGMLECACVCVCVCVCTQVRTQGERIGCVKLPHKAPPLPHSPLPRGWLRGNG